MHGMWMHGADLSRNAATNLCPRCRSELRPEIPREPLVRLGLDRDVCERKLPYRSHGFLKLSRVDDVWNAIQRYRPRRALKPFSEFIDLAVTHTYIDELRSVKHHSWLCVTPLESRRARSRVNRLKRDQIYKRMYN